MNNENLTAREFKLLGALAYAVGKLEAADIDPAEAKAVLRKYVPDISGKME